MKVILFVIALALVAPTLALAADPTPPPDPADTLSQAKIQIGQLFVALGSAELEVSKLKKELATEKAKAAPSPPSAPH